ncbi:MAG: tRNA (N6-threonylcarbamoyladenosine(37)-N6)-methyltransferase TrmO [Thermoplasmatales archaeon]|jgi:formylmethanofuran dehydrogenase subunit E|nr:MAG: tRNA (N6-threonylcarbamoyladenosine(37)-N6)-methyltransferase TrmO [Thermoplasmatales archaeon]
MNKLQVELKIIGIIHSPFKILEQAPRQGIYKLSEIEIYEEYQEGLKDIDSFTHLHIFYWLHKSKGFKLIVKTPWDDKPHGVFTTRSPYHPNPLAYSVVELVERKNNILKVKGLEAIEGTPVIDIKPYIKKIDQKKNVISGWSENIDFKF